MATQDNFYTAYDPTNTLHRRLPLFQMVTVEEGEEDGPKIMSTQLKIVEKTEENVRQADNTPWYFAVLVKRGSEQ